MNETSATTETPKKKSRAKKIMLTTLVALVVLIIILFSLLQFCLGSIIKKTVETVSPPLLGTEISIASVDVNPMAGIVDIEKLIVGPPEGFKANVFEMDNFRFIIDVGSVMTDTIIIREISIVAPEVSYELSGINSNVGAILKKLEAPTAAEEEPVEETEEVTTQKSAKKVVIESFIFNGAKIRLASTLTGGKGLVIPMPNLELKDIGRKSGGITGLDAFRQVIQSVVVGVLKAVRDAGLAVGDAALDGLVFVGEGAVEAVGVVGGAVVDGATVVGKGAAQAAGAVADGVGAAGGAVLDGAGAVGGAILDGAGAIGGAIGGLFGSDDKEEK